MPVIAVCINSVVAIFVLLSPAAGVGAVGIPVSAGLAFGARYDSAFSSLCTKAVVAILVVLSAAGGVTLRGVPVNTGLALSALRPIAAYIESLPESTLATTARLTCSTRPAVAIFV